MTWRRFAAILLLPAAAAVLLVAPVLVLGFLSDGVAGLPDLAPAIALVAGLITAAIMRPPERDLTGLGPEGCVT